MHPREPERKMADNMTSDLRGTERLGFRRWERGDDHFILEMYGMKEVYQFLGADPVPIKDLEEARTRIEKWNLRTSGMQGFWAVVPLEGEFAGQPVGTILLLPLPRSDEEPANTFEIGWHFHPKVWGKGYATESAQSVIDRAKEYGLSTVHAVVYATNSKSLALCDRLGMKRLGETDKWYKARLIDHVLNF